MPGSSAIDGLLKIARTSRAMVETGAGAVFEQFECGGRQVGDVVMDRDCAVRIFPGSFRCPALWASGRAIGAVAGCAVKHGDHLVAK